MKIFVISDTHHSIQKAIEVYKRHQDIDMIIHCGDYVDDALDFQKAVGKRMVYVKGNCDRSFDENDYAILETEAGDILVLHGHMQDTQRIYYMACEKGCVAAVYGHTHIPVNTHWDGIHLINPGSITKPRDNSSGSYAIINTTEDGLSCQIHYYDEPTKPKVTGGYLKGLLNYSDRF
ncbi:MAG: metallophosphoesterase [Clostridia bacterium]|nr:metallophosphoesterase [Clostridia bacterium]